MGKRVDVLTGKGIVCMALWSSSLTLLICRFDEEERTKQKLIS